MMLNDQYYQGPISNGEVFSAQCLIDYVGSEDEIVVCAEIDKVINNTWASPLAIDLNNDGFEIISLADSNVVFDFTGNRALHNTAWLGPTDGFLVQDKNNEGRIENIDEMFRWSLGW